MIATVTITALVALLLGALAGAGLVAVPAYRRIQLLTDLTHSWHRRAFAIARLAQANGVPELTIRALLHDEDPDPDVTRVLRGDDPTAVLEVPR